MTVLWYTPFTQRKGTPIIIMIDPTTKKKATGNRQKATVTKVAKTSPDKETKLKTTEEKTVVEKSKVKKAPKKEATETVATTEETVEQQTQAETPSEPKAEKKAEKEKTPVTKAKTMEELLKNTKQVLKVPRKGDPVIGTIMAITKKSLNLDIGAKTEGIVTDKEFDMAKEYIESLKVGEQLDAIVISDENSQGQVMLSLKKAAFDAKWDYFLDALKNNTVLEGQGVDVNKGGLIVVVNGTRGFVPSSQFSKDLVGTFASMKGRTLKVRAIEVDREKNRLIFSERHVSEEAEIAQKEVALDAVKVNEIYSGVVSGVMHFGLFVTVEVPVPGKDAVGHVEGLVHISEISWEKVTHPKEYHKVGDKIQVRVLGVDEKTGKLNLSIKQLSNDPWKDIGEKYQPGTTLEGTVSRVENFGVFVNVEAGIDGLIHSSKIQPGQTFNRGEQITVHVESVDPDQRRMSLSPVETHMSVEYR